MKRKLLFIVFSIFLVIDKSPVIDTLLLWPQFTVLQVTFSVSAPVVLPNRRLFLDWGFQFNYEMPFNPKSFYDISTFPGIFSKRSIAPDVYEKYSNSTNTISGISSPADMTAGEVYIAMEDMLVDLGYHETCLLKSVCELAQHPFEFDNGNLLAEILHFFLSPSVHRAFGRGEEVYKKVYEDAEKYGLLGEDCDRLYPKCTKSILDAVTKVVHED